MINYWQNIEFVNPLWLSALLLLPLLVLYQWFIARKRTNRMGFPSLDPFGGSLDLLSIVAKALPYLKLIALGMLIIAMARPRSLLKEEKIKAEGIDIMMVMDLSSSMLSRDFEPNRISVAKTVASDFVADRKYDRFGLTVFAGESYTQSPLTTDHGLIRQFLSGLDCGQLEDGTAIGMGLASAVNRLKDSEAKSRTIILLTDGVNNAGYVKPLQAANIAKEFEIKVYTIGIGSLGRAMSPVSRRADGSFVYGLAKVEIDEALLRRISRMTGGKYYRATDEQGLKEVYEEIDALEKTEIEVTTIKRYSEEYPKFVMLGLGLWLLIFLLQHTILKVFP